MTFKGHTMERDEWVFSEATNQIFVYYGFERHLGINISSLILEKKCMPPFFYVAFYWSQRFGWSSLQKFFANYEIDIAYQAATLPKTEQDKIDQWTIRISRIVGGNVILHMQAYDIQPNENFVAEQLAGLPVLDTKGMLTKDITRPPSECSE